MENCCGRDGYEFVLSSDAEVKMCMNKNDSTICKKYKKYLRNYGRTDEIAYFAKDLVDQANQQIEFIRYVKKIHRNLKNL